MNCTRLVVLLAMLMVMRSLAHAGDATTASPSANDRIVPDTEKQIAADVARVVTRMKAPDWRERQAAEDEAVTLGPEAIPALQRAANSTGDEPGAAEVQVLLKAAITRIRANANLYGTMVDLSGPFPNPAAAQEAIADALGVELYYVNKDARRKASSGPPVTFNRTRMTVLEALDQLVLKSRLDCFLNDAGDKLMAQNWPPRLIGVPTSYAGSIALRATDITSVQETSFIDGKRIETAKLMLRLVSEPKAQLVGNQLTLEIAEALDEQGRTLLAKTPTSVALSRNGLAYSGALRLDAIAPGASRIARLSGTLQGVTLRKSERFLLDVAAGDASAVWNYGDLVVHASVQERPDGRTEIVTKFVGESAVRLERDRRWSDVDADALFARGSLKLERAVETPADLTRDFDWSTDHWPVYKHIVVGEPSPIRRVIWTPPASVDDALVPVALFDLPLPHSLATRREDQ